MSLLGWFSHDKDPNFSIVVSSVEAINKNIKRILRKMVETSRDWSEFQEV